MKFVNKWMELEKNNPDQGNPDAQKQPWYVLTYMWTLVVK